MRAGILNRSPRRIARGRSLGLVGAACGFAAVIAGAPAVAREPAEIAYLLPKTRVTAGVSQTLVQCPPTAQEQAQRPSDRQLKFAYAADVPAKAVPDRLVRIDATSGFLVDRATTVKMTEDGLIKEFNGTAKGQGGPLLSSIIKAGAVGFGLLAGPLPAVAATAAVAGTGKSVVSNRPKPQPTKMVTAYYLQCTAAVQALVARADAAKADIDLLEARIIAGTASPDVTSLLAQRRAALVKLEAGLTQSVKLAAPLSPAMDQSGVVTGVGGLIPGPDFSKWVEVVPVTRKVLRSDPFIAKPKPTLDEALRAGPDGVVPGQYGYQVSIKIDDRAMKWFGCGAQAGRVACAADDVGDASLATRNMVYRRPIPGSASLAALHDPCLAMPCPAAPDGWTAGGEVSASQVAKFGQLSRLFYLPTGGGSIFGSRAVAAEFGAAGEPLSLKYERGSASADVAGIIDATAGAAQTIDGARLAATKAQIDRIEAAEKLATLLEADLDKPE